MASGRAGLSLCLAAQASTLSRTSDERRIVATASCPVVRRPFFVRAAICFLFFSPSSSTDPAAIFNPPRRKAAVIPALPGAYALCAVRARCAGRDCVHPQRQRVSLISVNGPRLGLRRARQEL